MTDPKPKPPRERIFSSDQAGEEYRAKQAARAKANAEAKAQAAAKSPRVDLPAAYYDAKAVGWAKTPKGYVVIAFELVDGQVHSPEILSEPSPRPQAASQLQLEVARRFLIPAKGSTPA